jgi:hypothetical protein
MTPREWMLVVLAVAALAVLVSFWREHHNSLAKFNVFDLVMENGRVSKISVSYMLVLGVSTWVIVNQEISGKLTEGIFGMWLAAWVSPLVARVVFGKTEMPTVETKP